MGSTVHLIQFHAIVLRVLGSLRRPATLWIMENAPDTLLSIPPDIVAQVRAEALEEHRPMLDILRDAVSNYVESQRQQRKQRIRRVFKAEELSDAEVAAIVSGAMDSRHDHLNAELE